MLCEPWLAPAGPTPRRPVLHRRFREQLEEELSVPRSDAGTRGDRQRAEGLFHENHSPADAADRILAGCDSTQMVLLPPGTSTNPSTTPAPAPDVDTLALHEDNGNVRITCAEARAHGIAPVHRGHPAYEYMRDADGDGVVCE